MLCKLRKKFEGFVNEYLSCKYIWKFIIKVNYFFDLYGFDFFKKMLIKKFENEIKVLLDYDFLEISV